MILKNSQSGQAALIVVLLTAVLITVGASTLSRTATDIRISRQVENGVQARLSAEAASEIALYRAIKLDNKDALPDCDTVTDIFDKLENADPNDHTSWPENCEVSEQEAYFWYRVEENEQTSPYTIRNIVQGDVVTLWLRPPDELLDTSPSVIYDETINFQWTPANADVELIVFLEYDDNDIRIKREYYNSAGSSGIDISVSTYGDSGDSSGADPDWMFVRIKPITEDLETLKIEGNNPFPPQGITVTSGGVTTSGVQQNIEVIKRYDNFAPLFDYVLYAGGDIAN